MFSVVGDYIVSLLLAWPGLLLGLLLSVDVLERTLGRRLFFPTHVKLIVAAAILVLGAITIHSRLSAPDRASIQRAQEIRDRHAREAAADDARRQRDEDSDRRLKSEAESLKQELANERRR
jgi:hypothetical protein